MTRYPFAVSAPLRFELVAGLTERATSVLVFAVSASLLWWMYGNQLILNTNDEGIYLDAAERILHGQQPYRDFFGYMSPGSFWMQALAFRLFGVTLAAGRLLVIFYAGSRVRPGVLAGSSIGIARVRNHHRASVFRVSD